jgi:hypothetical protein
MSVYRDRVVAAVREANESREKKYKMTFDGIIDRLIGDIQSGKAKDDFRVACQSEEEAMQLGRMFRDAQFEISINGDQITVRIPSADSAVPDSEPVPELVSSDSSCPPEESTQSEPVPELAPRASSSYSFVPPKESEPVPELAPRASSSYSFVPPKESATHTTGCPSSLNQRSSSKIFDKERPTPNSAKRDSSFEDELTNFFQSLTGNTTTPSWFAQRTTTGTQTQTRPKPTPSQIRPMPPFSAPKPTPTQTRPMPPFSAPKPNPPQSRPMPQFTSMPILIEVEFDLENIQDESPEEVD